MMVAISRLKVTAPSNSKRGILCLFTGATLVFDAINTVLTQPLSYIERKYTTAAKALSDASQNPWSCLVHGSPLK